MTQKHFYVKILHKQELGVSCLKNFKSSMLQEKNFKKIKLISPDKTK